MLYRLTRMSGAKALAPKPAKKFGIAEKQIETVIAKNPGVLFSDPKAVMIVATETAGERLADILALDWRGHLHVIEIKRHASNRHTVGQLLDYAAQLGQWTYDDFDRRWRKYQSTSLELREAFEQRFGAANRRALLDHRHFYILAASPDEPTRHAIAFLENSKLPIRFIPCQFWLHKREKLMYVEQIHIESLGKKASAGDWCFNTNEKYFSGAYKRILKKNVIAVEGYRNGEALLNSPQVGDRIFAYLDKTGFIAVGNVTGDAAYASSSVFRKEPEFHRDVEWLAVSHDRPVTVAQIKKWKGKFVAKGTALERIHSGTLTDKITEALRESQNEQLQGAKQ